MSKQDVIEVQGVVKEALPNATFQVELPNGQAADELHPHPSRRQGHHGDVALRPDQGPHHLALEINETRTAVPLKGGYTQ